MRFLMIAASASLIAVSALTTLRAQEDDPAVPSADLNSGSDAQIAPPTTPDEAAAFEKSVYGDDPASDDNLPGPVAQSRPWKLNLHASADSHYDDNIFISSAHKQSDLVTRLTAGGGITLGDYTTRQDNYLIADYTGIGEFLGRHTNQDAYEQNASFEGQVRFAHLTLHNDFVFQDLADEDVELGARARRQIYTDNFGARYDISDKTYAEVTSQVTIANYDLYLGSDDERGGLSFNYLLNPDVTIGLGGMGGILNVENSGSQTYEQLLSSFEIAATGKLTLKGAAGVEDRQLGNGGSLVSPVFELTGGYQPFEGFDLNLTAFRRILNSAYYTGYDFIATGVTAGLEYQLSPRFSLLLDAGWQSSDYRDAASGADLLRTDEYYFARPAVRYTVSSNCNVEIYYFHRNNSSTVNGSSFDNTQAGVALNFTY